MKDVSPEKPRMELRYPQSFLMLLLVGFLIVALPLIAGLLSNALAIEKLSAQSEEAVHSAVRATQGARQLSTLATAMQSFARLHAATGDSEALKGYNRLRENFQALLAQQAGLPPAGEMRPIVDSIRQHEGAAFAAMASATPHATLVENEFAELTRDMRRLTELGNQSIEAEVEALRAFADKSRNRVFWQMLSMVPAAILMIAGFSYLIARPIRDLDRAINRLGQGKLARRIRVSGPRDIEQLGAQLDWLRQRLIELEDQKTRFFQHVSHELKTPLTALRDGSELLSDEIIGKLNDEQREVARILKHNAHHLEKLIQDLLTYSQSQSAIRIEKKNELDIRPLQLKDLVDEVVAAQKIAIVAKTLLVRREDEDVKVEGDYTKLRVTLDNLLSNAVKFSPDGGIIVVRLAREDDHAVIDVIDQGPGIVPEDRERIFDPFVRGKSAETSGVKGTGLGLAIVRDYVELHGGMVQTQAADGAHFRVILPIHSHSPTDSQSA
jgi:two-component system sensor histidine kinase GlrK